MRSQNHRICRLFAETRLPDLAIRVGEVPGSNPGAPMFESPRFSGVFGVLGVVKVPMRFRLGRACLIWRQHFGVI
jgi:hypothetical protein